MRLVPLVLGLAACSGSGDGAVLTFTATEGTEEASRIEIVLASATADSILQSRQRMRPGQTGEEEVVYYRQRSTVDALTNISSLGGFEVRIEPDATLVPDESFIPFALIYDANDTLIAVGTVNDLAGAPSAVTIKPGVVLGYEVTVLALAPDDDAAGVADGQGHAVTCQGDTGAWRSGAVWKRPGGPQIRLLLPDLATDPAATDAMLRDTDLDCDLHHAEGQDCDDLRTRYHRGQTETCDGEDTDCDGRRLELIEGCSDATFTCSTNGGGVSLCAEGPNDNRDVGVCTPSAACGCTGAGGMCASCGLTWTTAPAGAMPCAPGLGKLHFTQCELPGCTIDVVGATGPWEIKIAAEEAGPFSTRLTGISTGYFYIRARHLAATAFPVNAGSIGAAYFGVTGPAGRASLLPVNLTADDLVSQCSPGSAGDHAMQCTP